MEIPVNFGITLGNPVLEAGSGEGLLLPESPLASGILGRVTRVGNHDHTDRSLT